MHSAVAYVNDVPILVQDWQREVRRARSEHIDSEGPAALPRSGLEDHGRVVLEDMLVRRLLLMAADQEQLSVSQDEIEAGYVHLQDGWSSAAFGEVMAHEDLSVSELRALVRETLMIRKYMRDLSLPVWPSQTLRSNVCRHPPRGFDASGADSSAANRGAHRS